jgi:hypothetical protein
MSLFDAVGWLLVIFLVGFIVYRALKTTSSIQIERDGIRTGGVMS